MERPTGSVIVNYGTRVLVETATGEPVPCSIRGKRLRAVCGDVVEWERIDAEGAITRIVTRERALERADGRGGSEPVASNLDRVLVVAAPEPDPDAVLIDRYLAMAERGGIDAALLLNKTDCAPDGFRARFDEYAIAGYPVWMCSAVNRHGLDALRTELSGRTTLLVGQSGVGKSSLLNALVPDLALQTGVLDKAGEGRHTTTATRRYLLPGGGALVDSPGVREFWLPAMPATDLIGGFREIARAGDACRFRNCTHAKEPDCAVQAAVARGDISERRYKSYLQLLRTISGKA
ncbi:MAG: ribosome small subunit-dependent GTPase A [Xanthomonadaceae bacterium]|nr:ribosome small subunit-dependent GTPase A [Xanthomonadaceae bacterium]